MQRIAPNSDAACMDAARKEALAAKRELILGGTWEAVAATGAGRGDTKAATHRPTRCVYFGGYSDIGERGMRAMVERKCGRMEAFEWHGAWCFAKWNKEDAAARALSTEWKEAARGSSLVVLPAPGGRVVRGGLLLEMGMEAS
jgi:hypothetical protein